MNRKQLIAAAALVLTGSAVFAQTEAELQHFGAAQTSVTTRAAVRNDVLRARAAGEALVPAEADVAGLFQKVPPSATTRVAVRAEVLKARADGSLDRPRELDGIGDSAVASVRNRAAAVQAGH